MIATLLLFFACASERDRFIEDYSAASCAYREACGLKTEFDGVPCEEQYLTATPTWLCDDIDRAAARDCVEEMEASADECPADGENPAPSCADVCPE